MSHPIVVIELHNNEFEALYSNSELTFILVNRAENDDDITISGPYASTVPKADLSKVIDGVTIMNDILYRNDSGLFSTEEETP